MTQEFLRKFVPWAIMAVGIGAHMVYEVGTDRQLLLVLLLLGVIGCNVVYFSVTAPTLGRVLTRAVTFGAILLLLFSRLPNTSVKMANVLPLMVAGLVVVDLIYFAFKRSNLTH